MDMLHDELQSACKTCQDAHDHLDVERKNREDLLNSVPDLRKQMIKDGLTAEQANTKIKKMLDQHNENVKHALDELTKQEEYLRNLER